MRINARNKWNSYDDDINVHREKMQDDEESHKSEIDLSVSQIVYEQTENKQEACLPLKVTCIYL